MKTPLVTITIPTYNSAKFISKCLDSVVNQTYKNIEINVIDRYSSDDTIEIVKKYGIRDILHYAGPLLGARHEGLKVSKGKYILLLDSDQILNKDAIKEGICLFENKSMDMLALEEKVYRSVSFLEKLYEYDRKLIHRVYNLSPFTGVILPRFYKREILQKAFSNIPKKIVSGLGGQDHAIIYYESWLVSKRVGFLKNAVRHIEPNSYRKVWEKSYRWGYTSIDAHYGKYKKLIDQKERFRTGLFTKGMVLESCASIVLLLLKGIPYKLGFLVGRVTRACIPGNVPLLL